MGELTNFAKMTTIGYALVTGRAEKPHRSDEPKQGQIEDGQSKSTSSLQESCERRRTKKQSEAAARAKDASKKGGPGASSANSAVPICDDAKQDPAAQSSGTHGTDWNLVQESKTYMLTNIDSNQTRVSSQAFFIMLLGWGKHNLNSSNF